jgi:hypothetical protein
LERDRPAIPASEGDSASSVNSGEYARIAGKLS